MRIDTNMKLAGAALLSTVVAACGSGEPEGNDPRLPAARPLDLIFGDCSSFRRYTKEFIPEMVTIAETSALADPRRSLWAACFDGAPLRTLEWNPKVDFETHLPELEQDRSLGDRVAVARAKGLRRKFEAMADTPTRVRGSGQLEALEVAAQTPEVGRVFMFTDGQINEVEGIVLKTATRRDIQATIKRWAPRLRGLKGVQLTFVGVGRGTEHSDEVRNARRLFRGLARRVEAGSFNWWLELPAGFRSGDS